MSYKSCPLCGSANKREFPAEICIHFPGIKNLSKPAVFAYPRLSLCADCGVAQFQVNDPELMRLTEEDPGEQSYRIAV